MAMAGNTLSVSELGCDAAATTRWNRFVVENGGNYCQLAEWRQILWTAYRLKTYFLIMMAEDVWQGILPVAVITSPLGHKAVSMPYCNYGGPLTVRGGDPDQVRKKALSYLKASGIRQIEMRELSPAGEGNSAAVEVTLILDLPESVDILWKKIGDKARNQVRKAERAGLQVCWGRDQVPELYEIYAENMGRLGTPVHARGFVHAIVDVFGDQSDVLTVRHDGCAIAAMLVLRVGDIWIDPIASARTQFNNMNPNMLMYWEALRCATLAGVRRFDFGRSKRDSGTYRFKRQWGARDVSLDYHTYADGVRVDRASTAGYRGRKGALFARLWAQLPFPLQLVLGPRVRRYIP